MHPLDIKKEQVPALLDRILHKIHKEGAVSGVELEKLAYIKWIYPEEMSLQENTLLFLMGLFYKVTAPTDLYSVVYNSFKLEIQQSLDGLFTPMQASILYNIDQNQNISFSAPTSSGKSHLFRTLLSKSKNDVVFIVPSRALLYEYLITLKEVLKDTQGVYIQQFVENVNIARTTRRIFVLTPERALDILKFYKDFNVELFVFDEAQLSEEEVRGLTFDALVRKVDKKFPMAKKLFAHPFIENPEAQLMKHDIKGKGFLYPQNVVGKIYLEYIKKEKSFNYFSPFADKPHVKGNKRKYDSDFIADSIQGGKRVLVYMYKSDILKSSFLENFEEYINLCPVLKEMGALEIVDKIKDYIGDFDNQSVMLMLLRRGIVIHHGSVPLMIRSLLEEFTIKGYAKICFSTSTLLQGVNMPFDVIWIYNYSFSGNKVLEMKNLIGRAGRSTKINARFDFGAVVVSDVKRFSRELNEKVSISEQSVLDKDDSSFGDDVLEEFAESIKSDTFNEDHKLPETRIERLKSIEVEAAVSFLLTSLFEGDSIISAAKYKKMKEKKRTDVKDAFQLIYKKSLGRDLSKGEKKILSKSITILLWQIQGRKFKEILRLRSLYLVDSGEEAKLKKKLTNGEISKEEYSLGFNNLPFGYSPMALPLPQSGLENVASMFNGYRHTNFNYDLLVYDTYDYLDKVISHSLADIYTFVFKNYYDKFEDKRANSMFLFFKYGTDHYTDVMLLRYGFSFEEISWVRDLIEYIDEKEIIFTPDIVDCTEEQISSLAPFLV